MQCNSSRKSVKESRNYTKKKTLHYSEQKEELVKEYLNQISDIPKERIAYVDETGIDSYLYREYGYAARGEAVYGKIPGKKFKRTNIVAARLGKKLIAPMQYNGTTDSTLFEFWFERCLLPCLPEDAVIVMDNASFHRKKELHKISAKHNCTLIFLPPYSPEFNPIENSWQHLKSIIRNNAYLFNSLDDAISFAFQVI